MRNKRKHLWIPALIFFSLSALLSLCFGAVWLSPQTLYTAILSGPGSTAGAIVWYSRLPRTLACIFAGSALAVSGFILQNVLGNKLASPSIIGVNAGAGLAVTVCCALGMLSGLAISAAAFAGAMAAALLIMFLSYKTRASRTTVILSGVAINSILNALRDGLAHFFPDTSLLSSDFRVGGFSSVSISRLIPAAFLIAAAIGICLTLHNELDILNLGEETAQSLGLSVKRMQFLFLTLAALLAGAAVSFSGLLSFVGLMIPHIVRKLAGSESKPCLPLCTMGGAGLVTFCDLLSRVLFSPFEFPVGILISVLGGPFFLILLFRQKGGMTNA